MVAMAFRTSSVPLSRTLPALVLAGCGGGVFIGVGDRFDDSPPSVSLATGSTRASPGQAVQFVAAASDESGIAQVDLLRLDGSSAVFVAADPAAPYEFTIAAPTDGRATLVVFARATDHEGNTADSVAVTVTIGP